MYLFDTDTLSNIVKRDPSHKLLDRLKKLSESDQFTSAINIGEIHFSAHRSPRREKILAAFREKVFIGKQRIASGMRAASALMLSPQELTTMRKALPLVDLIIPQHPPR